MARSGVDYETVKHIAIKLLSQGIAPSVQKLREVLGTGSNTTLANHLKLWREEFASKEVHHLPANMPKELIAAIEILWQTAMEQAQNQLGAYKQSLENEREKVYSAQVETEKHNALLQAHLNELHEKNEDIASKYQQLKTEHAILNERIQKKKEAYIEAQKQREIILQQHYKEKDEITIKIQMLQSDLKKSQEKLNEQSKDHQNHLKEQRSLQEQSENRWLQLIEQARQETKTLQKELKAYKENSAKDLKQVREKLAEAQQQLFEKVAQYNASSNIVDELRKEIRELKAQHNALQNKLIAQNNSNKLRKRTKRGEKVKELSD